MTRKAFAIGCLLGVAAAWASELRVAIVQGTLINTFTGSPGGKYSVQCPNIDGGSGQKVFYRPGCPTRADAGVQCQVDAGLGDVLMDFTAATGSQDPYKIDLAPTEDRIHLRSYTASDALWCTVHRRSPP